MKKCLFIVGNEWDNKYETCKELISRNHLSNILLFDISKFLQRKHYKENINEDYHTWLTKIINSDINEIIAKEINQRMKLNNFDNVIISGSLNYEDIAKILFITKIQDYNILYIDSTRELLYRNYSLNNNINLSYDEFNKQLDELHNSKFAYIKDNNDLKHYRKNNYDTLEQKIANYFGYRNLEYCDILKENYQWPIEPYYKLLEHDKYGNRPVHMILGKQKFHSGFDITTETLTAVKASIGGKVIYSGLDERIISGQSKWNERYGNVVEVVDNYGRKEIYAHLREVLVKEGEIVKQGCLLGLSGCSGGARVPHLHFEIRKINTDHSGEKNTINPITLLPEIDFSNLNRHFTQQPYDQTWNKMLEEPWTITDDEIPYSKSRKYIR